MRWISDSEEFCRALGITKVITKCIVTFFFGIVTFWKLLIHMWLFFFFFLPIQWNWVLHLFIVLIIRVDWFPEEGVSYSLSPSQESTALSCDGLKVLALISFSALFEWFYIIFAYINISGIGMHFIITDILAWIQLDRLMYPEKAMAPHSSTLAWKVPWTEEPDGCCLWGC